MRCVAPADFAQLPLIRHLCLVDSRRHANGKRIAGVTAYTDAPAGPRQADHSERHWHQGRLHHAQPRLPATAPLGSGTLAARSGDRRDPQGQQDAHRRARHVDARTRLAYQSCAGAKAIEGATKSTYRRSSRRLQSGQ